jgi:hypothetical protein
MRNSGVPVTEYRCDQCDHAAVAGLVELLEIAGHVLDTPQQPNITRER